MKKLFLLLGLMFIPFVANAESTSESFTMSGLGSYSEPSHLGFEYRIGGELATCIDANLYNPSHVNSVETLNVKSGSFAKGLIAMANYAKTNNVDNMTQAHAFRIYTLKKNRKGASLSGSLNDGIINNMLNYNSDDAIGKMVKIGTCVYDGTCKDEESKYLPSSTGNVGSFKVTKLSNTYDGDNGYATAIVSIVNQSSGGNVVVSGCSSDGLSCNISKDSSGSNNYKIIVKGNVANKNSIKVDINIEGNTGNGLINEVKLYTCDESMGNCSSYFNGPFQRFIKLISSDFKQNGSASIYIDVPNTCANIDVSTLVQGSKEEDDYIKKCGPIVHLEQSCGKSSCDGDSSYKAFNHSYVRMRNMKYLMQDLDNEGANSNGGFIGTDSKYSEYLDSTVNNYCGTFTTESVDMYTPATAASVSGQFFVFDSYTSNDYNNVNGYFRQPFIVERVKSTFFFHYKQWLSDYTAAVWAEINAYDNWQDAVKDVKVKYDAMIEAKKVRDEAQSAVDNESCRFYREHRYKNGKVEWEDDGYDSETCNNNLKNAKEAYESALNAHKESYEVTEPQTQQAYKSAIAARLAKETERETCVDALKKYSNPGVSFNSVPQVDFTYKQNSKTEGNKEYTINMVNNTEAVKYWPNVTSNSGISSYLGLNYSGLNSQGKNPSSSANSLAGVANKPYSDAATRQNKGVVLKNEKGETDNYNWPDGKHDNCKPTANSPKPCVSYDFDNLSFNSMQLASDGTIPYSSSDTNIVIEGEEKISKIYYYRPPNNSFSLMNSGEYKTLNYTSNSAVTDINGLEIGYVYNIELTSYAGEYTTSFKMNNIGASYSTGKQKVQELIDAYIRNNNITNFESTCNYCNMEMAFNRICESCEDDGGDGDGEGFEYLPQFYYRSISLSDVTPNERKDGETNWSDNKGNAAKALIELGSGSASLDSSETSDYIALNTLKVNAKNSSDDAATYLADSSGTGKHDIYDDVSRDYLEYEVTLTTKDLQLIKKNSAKSYFKYSEMNMCAGIVPNSKDIDSQYCFKCNCDMKECESSFVSTFFSDTSGRSKWKYYVDGRYCIGTISTCIKGLDYVEDGKYPDPLFPKQFLERYKNWP